MPEPQTFEEWLRLAKAGALVRTQTEERVAESAYGAGVGSQQAEIELWQEAMADAGRERIAVYEAVVEAAQALVNTWGAREKDLKGDFQEECNLRAALAALDEDSTNCPSAHN